MVRPVYDSCQAEVGSRIFLQSTQDQWNNLYPDNEDLIPPKVPEPGGCSVKIRICVDADHDGNLETWRFHTGILVYLNNLLIILFSKRLNTVEYSSF